MIENVYMGGQQGEWDGFGCMGRISSRDQRASSVSQSSSPHFFFEWGFVSLQIFWELREHPEMIENVYMGVQQGQMRGWAAWAGFLRVPSVDQSPSPHFFRVGLCASENFLGACGAS